VTTSESTPGDLRPNPDPRPDLPVPPRPAWMTVIVANEPILRKRAVYDNNGMVRCFEEYYSWY
jgi:hypothetical protein